MNIKKTIKSFAVCLCLAIVLGFLARFLIFSLFPLEYDAEIRKTASKYNIDEYFVMAVIKAESNFLPDADSGLAKGLMQLTDDTACWIAEKIGLEDFSLDKVYDPKINIELGCFYLRYLFDMYTDEQLVLACYNAGPGNVSKWLSDKEISPDGKSLSFVPFSETREYIKRVFKYENIYKKLY